VANESDILAKLNLGSAKSVLEGNPSSPLSELLRELAQDVTNQLTASLDSHGVGASLNLRQSIKPHKQVTIDGSTVSVGIDADFYWKFVDKGVNGTEVNHGSPSWGTQPAQSTSFHDAILAWIPTTGMTTRDNQTYDSMAWAIQSSIIKKGKKARPFFTDVVNDTLVEQLREPISKLLGRSITIKIVEPWQ
jgi:hypothetical protein